MSKDENWGKYLKEMQELQPLLRKEINGEDRIAKNDYHPIINADGAILNDPTVKKREKGEILDKNAKVLTGERKNKTFKIMGATGEEVSSTSKKREKMVEHIKDNQEQIALNMQAQINAWVEKSVRGIFNKYELKALKNGEHWPIRRKKLKIEVAHKKDPLPLGSDLVMILKNKEVVTHQIFAWEVEDAD